mmetsp:Transcript_24912/g.58035  ORF Transcript_24912/g.58035 Transcript_24912/m.58035 type:complete len:98 (-) Transcript_24912:903-1196(-)
MVLLTLQKETLIQQVEKEVASLQDFEPVCIPATNTRDAPSQDIHGAEIGDGLARLRLWRNSPLDSCARQVKARNVVATKEKRPEAHATFERQTLTTN